MPLRIAFTIAPILFGLDKLTELVTDNSEQYLALGFNQLMPGSASGAMLAVGGVEIIAGLLVAVNPRVGGLLVAAWRGGIIVSLLLVGGYGDVALRHLGLLLGALTLARLTTAIERRADAEALRRQHLDALAHGAARRNP